MPDRESDVPREAAPDAGALIAEIFDEAAGVAACAPAVPTLRTAYTKGGADWRPENLIGLIEAATRAADEAEAP